MHTTAYQYKHTQHAGFKDHPLLNELAQIYADGFLWIREKSVESRW
jgi:hypothetical protein